MATLHYFSCCIRLLFSITRQPKHIKHTRLLIAHRAIAVVTNQAQQ